VRSACNAQADVAVLARASQLRPFEPKSAGVYDKNWTVVVLPYAALQIKYSQHGFEPRGNDVL
jgi:hypothetical protein